MTERTNLIDSYRLYKETVAKPDRIDNKTYMKIVYGLMKYFMQKVLEGYSVRMGAKLGIIGVKGRLGKAIIVDNGNGNGEEVKGIAPNWAKTKEVWQVEADKMGLALHEYTQAVPIKERPSMVYCFNEHSDGNIYSILWHKEKVIVANKTYYNIRFSRNNKRTLSKLIFEGKEYSINET